ncbi:MAG: tRNA (N(6)-L-threonylcarbamoyladenosine(37)-C(2))-methylthiotransferase [Nanoarchaeota archaeon]|nr:tRNA (N(6)-L-threonylcarbamoyladenosine(37)-C(2))-methylthiotransferase [Nanoarchaeota archaeon]
MNIFIETYGCSTNIHESEIIAGLLQKAGYDIVINIDNSDIIIINSCIVKSVTEQKLLFRLEEITKNYPGKKIIIAGCAPETIREKLYGVNPHISLISTNQIKKIPQSIKKIIDGKEIELLGGSNDIKLCLPILRKNPIIGIVPISSGCVGECTYCETRLAKGKLLSYPKNKILEEISNSIGSGCKEIWLTAQDVGAYELDKYDESHLPDLLDKISNLPGKFSVRVGMINPNNIKPILNDLVSAFNNKKIYKFVHIPIQSGDNDILENMNRGYTIEDFEEIIAAFRDAFRCTIWTDIIVGYPGETEEQFRNTLELIKRLKPDYVNISRFAKRDNTVASKLQQLDTKEMKRRTATLTSLVNNISFKKNMEWLKWNGDILITEPGKKPGQWIGRNFAYKPVVINKSGKLLGKIVKVRIDDATPTTLIGWPMKE